MGTFLHFNEARFELSDFKHALLVTLTVLNDGTAAAMLQPFVTPTKRPPGSLWMFLCGKPKLLPFCS